MEENLSMSPFWDGTRVPFKYRMSPFMKSKHMILTYKGKPKVLLLSPQIKKGPIIKLVSIYMIQNMNSDANLTNYCQKV